MKHDFSGVDQKNQKIPKFCSSDGSACTDVSGIMDYFEPSPLSWTCCSREKYEGGTIHISPINLRDIITKADALVELTF